MEVDQDDFSVWMQEKSCAMDEMLRTFDDEQSFLTDDQKKTLCTIKDTIVDQINSWNVQKLRAQVGWPLPPDLDVLQPLCEKVALLLLKQMQQMKQYWEVELSKYFERIYDEAKRTFAAFIKRCLVIEKQPSSIVVKGTNGKQIGVSLRLLLGKGFFQEISYFPGNVTCSLHLENEVSCFYEERMNANKDLRFYSNVDVANHNIITNKLSFKEDKDSADVFRVMDVKMKIPTFKKNTVNAKSSQSGCSEKVHVAEQKSCFLFRTQVTFDGQSYPIETISTPFVVVSKPDYQREAVEATVFWDSAFGEKDRRPFVVPDNVPLKEFLVALNYRWKMSNDVELMDKHLEHLARKLIPAYDPNKRNEYYVSKPMFHKSIKNEYCSFSFSEWFFQILKFVHDFMKDEWKNGRIEGFIGRAAAEKLLESQFIGTFLLRFSDTSLPSTQGGISVAYKENATECDSLPPWTKSNLEKNTLSQQIRTERELVFLYDSHGSLPKEQVFILPPEERKTHPGYPKKKKKRVENHENPQFSPLSEDSSDSGFTAMESPVNLSIASSDLRQDQSSTAGLSEVSESLFQLDQSPFHEDPLLSQCNVQCMLDNKLNGENVPWPAMLLQ